MYGLDTEVLKMQIEDTFKDMEEAPEISGTHSEYSAECLIKCRKLLMEKVSAYRKELQHERLEKKKILLETEERIQSIRTFYTNIAIAPTRTGRIAKAALSSTHTAQQFLKEVVSTCGVP